MNPKHKEFINEYIETGNGTQSVKGVFGIENDNVAANKASRLLRNAKIQDYLEDRAELAATRVEQLMEQSENLPVALNAAKDILDRAGYKPIQRTDVTTGGEKLSILFDESFKKE